MAIVTKFGVWDAEVSKFIKTVGEKNKLSENKAFEENLKKWFYDEGVRIFQRAQSALYTAYEQKSISESGSRPKISAGYMETQKNEGFKALLPEIIKKFAADQSSLAESITDDFNKFAKEAVENHLAFYAIQAEITTNLNMLLDKDSSVDRVTFIEEAFVSFKSSKPELAQEITDHLLFLNEFVAYMKKQVAPVTKPVSHNPSPTFKPVNSSPKEIRLVSEADASAVRQLGPVR